MFVMWAYLFPPIEWRRQGYVLSMGGVVLAEVHGTCKLEKAWSCIRQKCFDILKTSIYGPMPQSNSKMLFKLEGFFFHGALYCCVRYSNLVCQDDIFKIQH